MSDTDFIDLDEITPTGSQTVTGDEITDVPAVGANAMLERTMDEKRKIIFVVDVSVSMNSPIPQAPGSSAYLTKAETSRQMLREAIEERFLRFADSDVSLIGFGNKVDLVKVYTREQLLERVDRMIAYQVGTNITLALETAVQMCKKAPSVVQVHNIVLITDGCDYGVEMLAEEDNELMKKCADLGIVLDVIFIATGEDLREVYDDIMDDSDNDDAINLGGDSDDDDEFADDDDAIDADAIVPEKKTVFVDGMDATRLITALRTITAKTNGRVKLVQTADDLKGQFLQTSRQLALPPAPGK